MKERSTLDLGVPSNANQQAVKAGGDKKPVKMTDDQHIAKIQGKVIEKTPGVFTMLKETFFNGTLEEARNHVIKNIFQPDIRAMTFNALMSFASVWIFGDDRAKRASSSSSYYRSSIDQGRTDYAAIARGSGGKATVQAPPKEERDELRDISFESRADAEYIANAMISICEEAGSVSVYSYYDLAHIDQRYMNYTQKNVGWIDLDSKGIDVYQTPEGWKLDLKRPINIDRALRARGGK